MAKKKYSYTEAIQELEDILERMENDKLEVDSLSTEIEKASQLIKLCKNQLKATEESITKILDKIDD